MKCNEILTILQHLGQVDVVRFLECGTSGKYTDASFVVQYRTTLVGWLQRFEMNWRLHPAE